MTSLNYWETNLFFVGLVVFCFISWTFRVFSLLVSMWFFKTSAFFSTIFVKTLITNLIVGTVTIHPLAFYMYVTLFIVKVMHKRFQFSTIRLHITTNLLTFFLIFTLFLGSIWAMQSNSWGYFWVNDAVEWLLLLFILYLVYKLHVWCIFTGQINFFLYSLALLNTLILIRLNFLPTRHNFITTKLTVYTIFFCVSLTDWIFM